MPDSLRLIVKYNILYSQLKNTNYSHSQLQGFALPISNNIPRLSQLLSGRNNFKHPAEPVFYAKNTRNQESQKPNYYKLNCNNSCHCGHFIRSTANISIFYPSYNANWICIPLFSYININIIFLKDQHAKLPDMFYVQFDITIQYIHMHCLWLILKGAKCRIVSSPIIMSISLYGIIWKFQVLNHILFPNYTSKLQSLL